MRTCRNQILHTSLALVIFSAAPALANPEVEKAVIDQIIENTKVTAKKLNDKDVLTCFSAELYAVEIETTHASGGRVTQDKLYLKTPDGVKEVTQPGTNAEMPELKSHINPDFKLKTDQNGKTMLSALSFLYNSVIDAGVEQRVIQNGTTWSFIMGDFFDDFSGFVIQTDDDGNITKISRTLRIKVE